MAKKGKKKAGKKSAVLKAPLNINITDVVNPGAAEVEVDQEIEWWNLSTDVTVTVVFPFDDVLGKGKKGFVKDIKPNKSHKSDPANATKKGSSFVYAVFKKSTLELIPGNSPPEIIIEG